MTPLTALARSALLIALFPLILALSSPSQSLSGRQFKLSHKLDAALASGPAANRLVYNPLARLVAGSDSLTGSEGLTSESAILDQVQADGTTLVPVTDPRVVFTPAVNDDGRTGPWQLARSPAFLAGASRLIDLAAVDPAPVGPSGFPPSISFTFVGTGLALFGPRSPQHGQALVRLDGRDVATVDAFGKFKPRQKLWSVSGLQHGMHTIQVLPTGTKQRRSGGVVVEVEGFAVVGLGGGGKQRVGSFAVRDKLGKRAYAGEEQEEWGVLGY